MELKTLISKTATDPELTHVRNSMRREDREITRMDTNRYLINYTFVGGLAFVGDQIVVPIDLRRRLLDILHFGYAGMTKMETEAKIFWWPTKSDIDMKVKDCTSCLASGKNLKYQLSSKHYGKVEKLTETEQEIQIDFTGKLHNQEVHGDVQKLIAVERFSKWTTVKICRTAETKEVKQFSTSNFNLYGIPEKNQII